MLEPLTAEQESEADHLFAQWRDAANAVREAEEVYGYGSPQHGLAVAAEGNIWARYKKLRPASEKNWA